RLVVNPFLILVGDVYDRRTGAPVPGATITLRRISGAHLSPDTITLVSDAGARVAWIEPTIVEFGVFKADVELSAPGYPRPFHIERDIPISYKDAEISFITLPMGFGLTYSGATSRRGTGQTFPGVQVEFRRTSGIAVQPDPLVLTAGDDGSFVIDLNPLAQGS